MTRLLEAATLEEPGRFANADLRRAVLKRDHWHCRYCGQRVSLKSANIDHVRPWKHGGPTEFKNLVTACWQCNKAKRNQLGIKPMSITERKRVVKNNGGRPIIPDFRTEL